MKTDSTPRVCTPRVFASIRATSVEPVTGYGLALRIVEMSEKVVYWHRELPPLPAEIVAEHTVEAASARVPGTIAHRDDLWDVCYSDLMARTQVRLEQEVARLHGDYARVFVETIETCRDDAKGESWLRGRFSYVLYRRPTPPTTEYLALTPAQRN